MRWVVHRCVSTPASPVVSHRPDHQQPEWVLRPFVEMGPVPHRCQDPPRVVGHAAVNDAADETLCSTSARKRPVMPEPRRTGPSSIPASRSQGPPSPSPWSSGLRRTGSGIRSAAVLPPSLQSLGQPLCATQTPQRCHEPLVLGFRRPHSERTDLGTEADRSRRVPHRRLHADHYCPTTAEVELTGLEPVTPCLQSRCATNCAIAPTNRPGR